jgi:hypothetical protein
VATHRRVPSSEYSRQTYGFIEGPYVFLDATARLLNNYLVRLIKIAKQLIAENPDGRRALMTFREQETRSSRELMSCRMVRL